MLHWIKTHKYALVGLYLFVFLAGFGLLELVVNGTEGDHSLSG